MITLLQSFKVPAFSKQLPNMARNVLECGRKLLFYQNINWKLKHISSDVVRQNVSGLNFFLIRLPLWNCRVFVYFCTHVLGNLKKINETLLLSYVTSSELVISLSSSFPLQYFLCFLPPSSTFNALIVWKAFFFAICCGVQGTLTLPLKTKYYAKSGTLYFLILIQKDCCCSKRKLSVLSLDKDHALENTIYLTRTFELQDIFSNEKEGKEQVHFS